MNAKQWKVHYEFVREKGRDKSGWRKEMEEDVVIVL